MIMTSLIPKASSNEQWFINPIEPNTNKYFDAKLYSCNVFTSNTYINFETVLLIKLNGNLPRNFILMSFNIPEYVQENIKMIPTKINSIDNDWLSYKVIIQIPKNKLSYATGNFEKLIVPVNIGFACNQQLLSEIANQLDSSALKHFLDSLYEKIITYEVSLDSFFKFSTTYGSADLYEKFPSTTNNEGTKFNFSWSSNYYMNLIKSQSISDLLEITSTIPLVLSNLTLNFYYHIPNISGYKLLSHSETRNYSLLANQTHVISLPFKVVYDEEKKELVKELQTGHNFLLPEGGNGYYEISFNIQSENSFYRISGINDFNYNLPMNDSQKLDFFVFKYQTIDSLNNFTRAY